ncbi:hypothetical protein M409DRAFT_38102, partial [Zasmidium cellare ATCC 36951]
GGHEVLLQSLSRVTLKSLDITMLAADMGIQEIPTAHPDACRFLPQQLGQQKHDLVICDGQVLRTHQRQAYRDRREARRLTVTQLALGLEHLREGGNMIVLLHRIEQWESFYLLYTFDQFSTVKVFKPRTAHTKRSSFYLVASDVQSKDHRALSAVTRWKTIWRVATFGTDEEYAQSLRLGNVDVATTICEFGETLATLGEEIWDIQAHALERAPFNRGVHTERRVNKGAVVM